MRTILPQAIPSFPSESVATLAAMTGDATGTAVRPRADDAGWWLTAVVGLNALWVIDLFVLGGGVDDLSAPGAVLTALGRLTGLFGALALVLQLVLIARVPWLESRLGMDRLTRWHRWSGFWLLWLLVAHVGGITLGYAAQEGTSLLGQVGALLFDTEDVLKAAVAFVLLVGVAVTSARVARRRLRYETWHFVHLYAYLAVLLGFLHQVSVGRDFVDAPVGRAYWWGLYGTALALVLVFRVAVPLWRGLRHDLRVVSVVPESRDVLSVYVTGRRLGELRARAGQFFLWRFLTRDRWWEAHPYSLSAMPNGRTLRITVKALGDGSAALWRLRPGTRVLAEGPYGAFTTRRRTRHGVLLIGGGIGITPIRALFEELGRDRADIVVIYRVADPVDAALARELTELSGRYGGRLHVLAGPPDAVTRFGPLMGPAQLAALVPDLPERDVFVCGPPGMTDATLRSLRAAGVPTERCHTERFALSS
jgi:predicted ferric reductase